MKNIRQFLLGMLFLLSAIPVITIAYTGQYSWDPIYVTPTQQTLNSQTEQSLKSQYGISAYYSCYPCADADTSNPYTQTSCLSQTKYCLEKKAIANETQCSYGYIYSNGKCESMCASANSLFYDGKCISRSDLCVIKYGEGSYTDGVIDPADGKFTCDCGSGYQWNTTGTACEKASTAAQTNNTVDWDYTPVSDGDLVREIGGIDVYIYKFINGNRYKRLVLSPSVFKSYGHLKWENVKELKKVRMDSFITSDLVRVAGDNSVYRLYPSGDTGEKRPIASDEVFTRLGLARDSIYEINTFDRDSYITGVTIQ